MKTYIGTKQVKAEPMDELAAVEKGYARKNDDNHEWRQGYHVQYANPDGSTYDSWSPKDVFERSYNVCDEEQIAMVCFPLTNRSINKAVSLLTIGGADDKTLEEVAAKMVSCLYHVFRKMFIDHSNEQKGYVQLSLF